MICVIIGPQAVPKMTPQELGLRADEPPTRLRPEIPPISHI